MTINGTGLLKPRTYRLLTLYYKNINPYSVDEVGANILIDIAVEKRKKKKVGEISSALWMKLSLY